VINEMVNGPDGMPTGMMRNAIGELDVDIILDEGPDTITLMQDTYEAISQALPAVAPMLTPGQATAVMRVLIETSPLPADVKKTFREAGEQEGQQPDPKMQEAQAKLALQQAEAQAKIAVEREKMQAENAHKEKAAMIELEIEKNRSANDIQIEREKAYAQMEIEKFKAEQQTQLAIAKADVELRQKAAVAQQQQQPAFDFGPPDDEVTQQALHYRQGLEFERKRESERSKAEERRINQTDAALSALAAAIAQSHQGVLAAVSKPRKATIHRDPKTGKVIGASSVTED